MRETRGSLISPALGQLTGVDLGLNLVELDSVNRLVNIPANLKALSESGDHFQVRDETAVNFVLLSLQSSFHDIESRTMGFYLGNAVVKLSARQTQIEIALAIGSILRNSCLDFLQGGGRDCCIDFACIIERPAQSRAYGKIMGALFRSIKVTPAVSGDKVEFWHLTKANEINLCIGQGKALI